MGHQRSIAAADSLIVVAALLSIGCRTRVEFDPLRTRSGGERVSFETIRSVDVDEAVLGDGAILQGFPVYLDVAAHSNWRNLTFEIRNADNAKPGATQAFALAIRTVFRTPSEGQFPGYAFPSALKARFHDADDIWRGQELLGAATIIGLDAYLNAQPPAQPVNWSRVILARVDSVVYKGVKYATANLPAGSEWSLIDCVECSLDSSLHGRDLVANPADWPTISQVSIDGVWYFTTPNQWSVRLAPDGVLNTVEQSESISSMATCGAKRCTRDEFVQRAAAEEQAFLDQTYAINLVRSGGKADIAVLFACVGDGPGERCLKPGKGAALVARIRGGDTNASEFPFRVTKQNAYLSFITGLTLLGLFLAFDVR